MLLIFLEKMKFSSNICKKNMQLWERLDPECFKNWVELESMRKWESSPVTRVSLNSKTLYQSTNYTDSLTGSLTQSISVISVITAWKEQHYFCESVFLTGFDIQVMNDFVEFISLQCVSGRACSNTCNFEISWKKTLENMQPQHASLGYFPRILGFKPFAELVFIRVVAKCLNFWDL